MSTKSKAKGTKAETDCVKYLKEYFPRVERRALAGNKDKGDLANIPKCVGEVKADKSNKLRAWQLETLDEMENAGEPNCFLVVKVPYKNVSKWDFWIPAYQVGLEDVSDPMEARWVRMDFELGRDVLRRLIDLTRFL
jgi:hypothetical protein